MGSSTDGRFVFAVGKTKDTKEIAVVVSSTPPSNLKSVPIRTIDQLLKFSHPDAWQRDKEAIDAANNC